jgi:hypothetical protein
MNIVSRYDGRDRYDTNYRINLANIDSIVDRPTNVGITSGVKWPDALVGGAAIGKMGGIMIITNGVDQISSTAMGALDLYDYNAHSRYVSMVENVKVFGGNETVSEQAVGQMRDWWSKR